MIPAQPETTLDFETCWRAFDARDPAADGQFIVAVQTTRIYCRPTCPARRPRRENVTFYADCAGARAAGYRACKRCQPDLNHVDEVEWVKQVCALIDSSLGAIITLDALGLQLNISPGHLQKVFKKVMGITPRQYAESRRRERFKTALKCQETVLSSTFEAGYSSSSSFHENGGFGMTPGTYKKGGAGMTIHYVTVPCPLGWLLIAATERGVNAVRLGDSPEYVLAELKREFPAAQLEPATSDQDKLGLDHYAKSVVEHLEGKNHALRLPLDLRATAFQARVWQLLQDIPYGDTRSYSEVAAELGQPTAARAVARAVATNPVALLIPCHRVVEAGGGLGGYRWGIERKKALLELEQAGADQTN